MTEQAREQSTSDNIGSRQEPTIIFGTLKPGWKERRMEPYMPRKGILTDSI